MHSELNLSCLMWWRNWNLRAEKDFDNHSDPFSSLQEKLFDHHHHHPPTPPLLILSLKSFREGDSTLPQQSVVTGIFLSCDLDTSSLSLRIVFTRNLLPNYNLNPLVLLSFAKSRFRANVF